MKPIILVAATSCWIPTARIVMALADAGCIVDAVCPTEHPLCKTSAVRRIHEYRGLAPLRSLAEAIAISKPDLIVPGDDLSTRHMHELYRMESRRGGSGVQICELIERSFGPAESFSIVDERTAFMTLASEAGIRVPKTGVIDTPAALRRWVAEMGFPVVLKANGTSGGYGVRIARTSEEAEQAFRKLQAPPLIARAVKRALVNRDKSLVWPSLCRRPAVVNAQTFIQGHEATSTVACWKGTVMAALHFEVIRKRYSSGPASVMKLIDHPEITAAVEKMVRRLKLSGLHGFDFMLEAETGNAYLIEINPRTTQVGHLTLGPERDLPAAICAALTGNEVRPAAVLTENDTITLFPQEWMRDPSSPFLQSGYVDVPWQEPDLIRECIQQGRKQHGSKAEESREQALAPVRAPRL